MNKELFRKMMKETERDFWELDDQAYIVCERHKNKPMKKIIICYICDHKNKCKKNLKLWKRWFQWLKEGDKS